MKIKRIHRLHVMKVYYFTFLMCIKGPILSHYQVMNIIFDTNDINNHYGYKNVE